MNHGIRRRLQRLTNDDGVFCVAAVDHRDALVAEFAEHGDGGAAGEKDHPSPETLTTFKADVLGALGTRPSAVMIEPEFSFPHLTDAGLIDRSVGVICALESQGYMANPADGNELLPGWTPAQALEAGADAAKLFVLYRADDDALAPRQERLIRRVVEQCAALQLPVLVEPIPYDFADDAERRELILRSASRLTEIGPMILKMPFPGSGSCELLSEACGNNPWALLSWGVGFDDFVSQLNEAAAAGCSGFMVGRALWREALPLETRPEVLNTTVVERFDDLCAIAVAARPWHHHYGPASLDDWPWAR